MSATKRAQRGGFSTAEVLVGATLGLVGLGALCSIFSAQQKAVRAQNAWQSIAASCGQLRASYDGPCRYHPDYEPKPYSTRFARAAAIQ